MQYVMAIFLGMGFRVGKKISHLVSCISKLLALLIFQDSKQKNAGQGQGMHLLVRRRCAEGTGTGNR